MYLFFIHTHDTNATYFSFSQDTAVFPLAPAEWRDPLARTQQSKVVFSLVPREWRGSLIRTQQSEVTLLLAQ